MIKGYLKTQKSPLHYTECYMYTVSETSYCCVNQLYNTAHIAIINMFMSIDIRVKKIHGTL